MQQYAIIQREYSRSNIESHKRIGRIKNKNANNFTADTLILAFSSQIENSSAIFAIEKLQNSKKLFNTVANMTINEIEYKLNTATASDAQVEFASNPGGITHNSNVFTHKNLLISQMIGIQHK